MTAHRHVDESTLTVSLFGEPLPGPAAAHLAECAECRARRATLERALEAARRDTDLAADDALTPDRLARQRQSIERRVAHLGEPARVLTFPERHAGRPPVRLSPGWLVVAAAAGLLIGVLLSPQLPTRRSEGTSAQSAPSAPAALMAADDAPADPLLQDVEDALDLELRPELEALDGLTPVNYEIR